MTATATSAPDLVLVTCGATKLTSPAPAGQLYTGGYHRLCRQAADALAPAAVLIVSALHGLLDLAEVVEPYDQAHAAGGAASPDAMRCKADQLGVLGARLVVALGGAGHVELARPVWPGLVWPLAGLPGIGQHRAVLAGIRRTGRLPAGSVAG